MREIPPVGSALRADVSVPAPQELDIDVDVMQEESRQQRITEEAALQDEYTRTEAIYRAIQAEAEAITTHMPDFRRVSAELPANVRTKIDEMTDALMSLSLNASADRTNLRKSLETMVKKGLYDAKIAELHQWRMASENRMKQWQGGKSALSDEARAEEVLRRMREKGEMRPLPVVGDVDENQVAPRPDGFFARFKKWLQSE